MKSWWQEHPERLEYELEALRREGIAYKVDGAAKLAGQLRVTAWPLVNGEPTEVEATFPDLYPEFRFDVTSRQLQLDRHQHRLGGNLCLIGRRTENWAYDDTLAIYLVEKLPELVRAVAEGPGSLREEPQAEPESDYFSYEPGAAVVIDGSWRIPGEVSAGTIEIALLSPFPWDGSPLRGVALQVSGSDGTVLLQTDARLGNVLSGAPTILGRWVRLGLLPDAYADPATFREHLRRTMNVGSERGLLNPNSGRAIEVVAGVFPEEHAWPTQRGDGWVFLVSQRSMKGKKPQIRRYFCRVERAGPSDVTSRVADEHLFADRRVAIFGLGALGAPIAKELNKVGLAGLNLNDPDRVDPGTSSRTPYGLFQAGLPKPAALAQTIIAHLPYTEIKMWALRVGAVRPMDGPHEVTILNEILDRVDLVVDATAEIGVQMTLSRICRERRIPCVLVSATPGAWGGTVAHFQPDTNGACALCWAWARRSDSNLSPPAAPGPGIQPPGCADPTFTGTGYDLAEISMQGVRAICDILQGRPPKWNVAICSLRDRETGERVMPRWSELVVPRHPSCGRCWDGGLSPQ